MLMHELAITQSILDIALRHAQGVGAEKITNLYLVIGDLSTVVDDSVQFYWDFISEGTIAWGAQLRFRRIPAAFACQSCARAYTLAEDLTCPACGSSDVRVTAGEEFYLEAIDVEDAAASPQKSGEMT